jgi:hypothetical protein
MKEKREGEKLYDKNLKIHNIYKKRTKTYFEQRHQQKTH